MRSSPNSDLRVHPPGAGQDVAGREVAQVPGDRGRADVDGDPVGASTNPGQTATMRSASSTATVTAPSPRSIAGCSEASTANGRSGAGGRVAATGRRHRPLAVCSSPSSALGSSTYHSVNDGSTTIGGRSRSLRTTWRWTLAGRRDVDDDIVGHGRRAPEPMPLEQRAVAPVVGLDRRRSAERLRPDRDPPLGERTARRQHLAAAADTTPTTHRVEVGAQSARRFEHGGAVLDRAVQPRRREDDPVIAHETRITQPAAGAGPRGRRDRPRRSGRSGRGWHGSRRRSRDRFPSARRPPSRPP